MRKSIVEKGAGKNNYLYNGKELNTDFGLDWSDYGARYYDAAIGRFTTIDPHAENYFHISPFVYTANNPVLLIDPDGKDFVNVHTKRKEQAQQDLDAATTNLATVASNFDKQWEGKDTGKLKGKEKRTYNKAKRKLKKAKGKKDKAQSVLNSEVEFEQVVDAVLSEFQTVNPSEFSRWNDFFIDGNGSKRDIEVSAQDVPIQMLNSMGLPTGNTTSEGVTYNSSTKNPATVRLRTALTGSPLAPDAISANTSDLVHGIGHIDGALKGSNTEAHANLYEKEKYVDKKN